MKVERMRWIAGLAGCIVAVGGASACGADAPTMKPAVTDRAPIVHGSVANLDQHRPADLAFYRSFRQEGAISVKHFDTLEAGAKAATAVIVAEVTDVRHTRTLRGERADDTVQMIGVVLRPVEILAGELPTEHRARLTVEFLATSAEEADSISELRAGLPVGQAVWFLHRKGDSLAAPKPGAPPLPPGERQFYRTISPQGMFVQGEGHVECPLVEQTSDGLRPNDMTTQGETYATLSQLVVKVRGVRS